MPTISTQQPMRPAEIELVEQVNANTDDISSIINERFPVQTADIGDLQVTDEKLSFDLQNKISLISTFPTLTYGESNAVEVPANSNVIVDITFPNPLTEAPNVYCMARSSVCVECNVEQVTNSQVSIRLYNNTTSDAESVSVDWLAISGR